ncbi:zinc finger protein 511-like [Haliotis rufescens]|uniref:zinc finger protein 511-like n=1 Tax=Haliotis rufescens TaxID=6454 RepID=UPI00201F42EB|nr:zinc finger protein 511-like [Haliotis rufescens]XP_046358498.2 zinc finger protein 511-like [Haliotis rufescens]XP_046358499.2 zinc finger protein 511-like [Haliotis rufescens]
METQATVWQWRPQKRSRDVRDQFFEDGDRFCCYSVKQLPLETDTIDCRRIPQFPCSIAGCPETFDTLLGYESHYNSVHRHTCSECRRSYPSNHLLEIHLRESHDPLFSLQSGDKFVCLVQGCGQTFSAPKSRKNHMVKKHKYPANYRFDRAKPGKAAVRQSEAGGDMVAACPSEAGGDMVADRQSEAGDDMAADRQSEAGDMEVAEKENIPQEGTARRVFSYKVPQNICFGHGSTRSFQRPRGRRKPKHWHQSNMETDTTVHIENVDMGELKDALE